MNYLSNEVVGKMIMNRRKDLCLTSSSRPHFLLKFALFLHFFFCLWVDGDIAIYTPWVPFFLFFSFIYFLLQLWGHAIRFHINVFWIIVLLIIMHIYSLWIYFLLQLISTLLTKNHHFMRNMRSLLCNKSSLWILN